MDQNIVVDAVIDTLELIIQAIEQTHSHLNRPIVAELPNVDIILHPLVGTINADLESLLQTCNPELDDMPIIGETEEHNVSRNFLLSQIETEFTDESKTSKYWNETCQDGELDYQNECTVTKVWLSNELSSLQQRSKNRAKLAEMVRRDKNITRIQSLWRGFKARRESSLRKRSLNLIRAWCRMYLARRRFLHMKHHSNALNSIISSCLSIATELLLATTLSDCLQNCINTFRDESKAAFHFISEKVEARDHVEGQTLVPVELYKLVQYIAHVPNSLRISAPVQSKSCARQRRIEFFKRRHMRVVTEKNMTRRYSLRSRFVFSDLEAKRGESIDTLVKLAANDISDCFQHLDGNIMDVSVESLADDFFVTNANSSCSILVANVNKITSLCSISNFANLRAASLNDNHVQVCDSLSILPKLQHLSLDSNKIEGAVDISLNSLLSISLNCNKIRSFRGNNISSIQRISLYSNNMLEFNLSLDSKHSNLVYLNLGRNRLSTLNWSCLSQLSYLNTLILSQNCLEMFPYNLSLPFLQSLWLNGNKLSGVLKYPGNIQARLPMLRRLYLQDNAITFIDRSIAATSPNLFELDISFNNISSPSIFRHLSHFRHLRQVQISDNPLSVSHAYGVEQLKKGIIMAEMKTVCFSGNGIFSFSYNSSIFLQHFSYCLRTSLEMSNVKRKRLISELRNKGKKFADIETTAVFDSTSVDCLRSLNEYSLSMKTMDIVGKLPLLLAAHSIAVSTAKVSCEAPIPVHSLAQDISPEWQKPVNVTTSEQPVKLKVIQLPQVDTSSLTSHEPSYPSVEPLDESVSATESFVAERGPKNEERATVSVDAVNQAVIVLQRFFSRQRKRKIMKSVIETVRYKDDEIDELLAQDIEMDWLGELELGDVDDCPKEFTRSSVSPTVSSSLIVDKGNSTPMAYGDHIRRRNLQLDMKEISQSYHEEVKILTSKSAPSDVASVASRASGIRDEWGIQNDCLLSTMLKRQKKIKKRKEKDSIKRK